ncbi:MAG: hypothetical protein ACK5LN_11105 [Propioniciclava sp.]
MTSTPAPWQLGFVCTANICRSAYADVRARSILEGIPGSLQVHSAGIYGHTGASIDTEMGREAVARGADISSFLARRVTRAFISESDLVLTAEAGHRTFILEEWPMTLGKVFTFAQFVEGIDRVEEDLHGEALVAEIRRKLPPAQATGNIPDPYQRGDVAAEECANLIDSYLWRILPRLVPSSSRTTPSSHRPAAGEHLRAQTRRSEAEPR